MEKLPVQLHHFSAPNSTNDVARLAGGYQNIDSKELRIAIPVTLAAICLIGSAGNFLVFAVLMNNARKGKTSMINSLILNMSVADLLIMLFCVPFRAVAYSRSSWVLGWFICKTADWFLQSCLAAKSFTLAVLAKACFMYVTHPSKQVQIRHQRIAALIISIWALAFILPVPHWLFASLIYEADKVMCIFDTAGHASNFVAVFAKLYPALVYCLPVLFTFIYHWKAFRRCKRRGSKTQNLRNQIRGKRLTVMLFSVSLAFASMCAPEWVVWFWIKHVGKGDPSPPPSFVLLSQVLVFSISSVNPLIFVAMSEEFKEGFLGLWKRLIFSKPQASPDLQAAQQQQSSSESVPTIPVPSQQEKSVQVPDKDPVQDKVDSPTNKTANIVLSDMEQFWHDRQNAAATTEEDPIPWEHQSDLAGSSCPETSGKM
ncbi:G-protein coupled receptor 151 [Heterodontus francisci]|uniref:G-protein coupled receptor 151 n=1 Tax=Heterodontus francisci TaxID=7792 RepID=UPI00355C7A9C